MTTECFEICDLNTRSHADGSHQQTQSGTTTPHRYGCGVRGCGGSEKISAVVEGLGLPAKTGLCSTRKPSIDIPDETKLRWSEIISMYVKLFKAFIRA